jgi:cytochrome c oxidase cbb3-type subunit IV
MDYTTLRHFADSWGLLFMFLMFVGLILWVWRPGSRKLHQDSAEIPFRNEDRPARAPAPAARAAGGTSTTRKEAR